MGLFDDINKFLESQLDEFLHKNPHLELQAILEQLQEQEQENKKLILQLQSEEKRLQKEILILAKDLQTWHVRIGKRSRFAASRKSALGTNERDTRKLTPSFRITL